MATVRAIALVGFYRSDLVEPGTVLELPLGEFAELRAFNKVDYAPPEPPAVQEPAPKGKGR